MKINLRGNKVAVEKIKTAKSETSFLVVPETEEYCGIVKYVGELASQDLKAGQKVYFSTNFQNLTINGTKLCVLEDKEIFAIVE